MIFITFAMFAMWTSQINLKVFTFRNEIYFLH